MRRVRNLIISMTFWAGRGCLSGVMRALGVRRGGHGIVLYYHDVKDAHRALFARQLDALLGMAHMVAADEVGGLGPGRHVAITFDDALSSAMRNAIPELVARGIPCTIFVPSGLMGQKPNWFGHECAVSEDEHVADVETLQALPEGLVRIGSHTVSHCNARKLPFDELDRELRDSRRQLETILGRPVRLLAFPYGGVTRAIAEHALAAGYTRVFSTRPGQARMTEDDVFVGRVNVHPTDWRLEFFLKSRGAYSWQQVKPYLRDRWYPLEQKSLKQV